MDINTARQYIKNQCIHGHELNEENLYIDPRGRKYCKACRRDQDRRRRAENKMNPRKWEW